VRALAPRLQRHRINRIGIISLLTVPVVFVFAVTQYCKERPGTKIADVSPPMPPGGGRSARISNSAAGRSWQLKSVSPVKSVSLGFQRSVCRRKCGWPPRTRRRGVHDSREPVEGGQALDKYLEVADLPPLSPASDPVGLFSVISSHQAIPEVTPDERAANVQTQALPPRPPNRLFTSSKEKPCCVAHASRCVTSTGSGRVRDASSASSGQPA
jgi:hypothetical protein